MGFSPVEITGVPLFEVPAKIPNLFKILKQGNGRFRQGEGFIRPSLTKMPP